MGRPKCYYMRNNETCDDCDQAWTCCTPPPCYSGSCCFQAYDFYDAEAPEPCDHVRYKTIHNFSLCGDNVWADICDEVGGQFNGQIQCSKGLGESAGILTPSGQRYYPLIYGDNPDNNYLYYYPSRDSCFDCITWLATNVCSAYDNRINSCCTPPVTCFVSGTKIKIPNGYKNIEDIQIGDEVETPSGNTTILELIRPILGDRKLVSLNSGDYFFTEDHPIKTTQGFKAVNSELSSNNYGSYVNIVGDLNIGDVVINEYGFETVQSISLKQDKYETQLYDLHLKDYHEFYADSLVFHNCIFTDTFCSEDCVDESCSNYPMEINWNIYCADDPLEPVESGKYFIGRPGCYSRVSLPIYQMYHRNGGRTVRYYNGPDCGSAWCTTPPPEIGICCPPNPKLGDCAYTISSEGCDELYGVNSTFTANPQIDGTFISCFDDPCEIGSGACCESDLLGGGSCTEIDYELETCNGALFSGISCDYILDHCYDKFNWNIPNPEPQE